MTAAASSVATDTLVAQVGDELDRWTVPGLELAIVRGGDVLFAGGVGVRGVDDATAVGARTLFDHGSCGKAYTSLLAALVEVDGLLDLDAPVRRYVPELRLPDAVVADRVTTRDLLSHRSGLARHDLTWILHEEWDRAELVRRLEHLAMHGDLRASWNYSNLGYALAGVVIERVTGHTWESEIERRIFAPLGMRRAATSMAQVLDDADRARPHLVVDGKAVATEARVLRAAAPAGGIVTCAEDASRWLLLQTGHGPIPADVVARTHDLQAPLPTGALPFTEMRFVGYAMGWVVGTYKGRAASWHSGGVDGYLTQTLVLPDDGIAVVACANSHLSGLPLASVLHVVDGLLGETVESTWFDRMAPDAHVEADGGADGRATDTVPAAEGPRAHPLESYAGTYTDRGYGDLVVAVDGSELTVSLGLVALPAAHRRFDTWNLHYAPLELDLPATFVTDANGAVAEVVVPLDPATEPARFRRVEAANP